MIGIGVIVAIIIALTELIKRGKYIPVRFIPLFTLVIGIIGGILFTEGDLKIRALYGLGIGLGAAGLFDQSKLITKRGDK